MPHTLLKYLWEGNVHPVYCPVAEMYNNNNNNRISWAGDWQRQPGNGVDV